MPQSLRLTRFVPYGLLLVLLLPVIWPLLQTGFFVSDDGGWMIIRLSAFHQALRTGQFPVRFLETLNHSFGYPVLNFNYPLPFYLGEIVHLAGFDFVTSIKILFLGSFLFGGFWMYLWAKNKWGPMAGVVAAVYYSYAPYRVFDVYNRGSLGEAIAFAILPLLLYFVDKYSADEKALSLYFGSISMAALILSHNTLAMLFMPIVLIYIAYGIYLSRKKRFLTVRFTLLVACSLLLSAWFWFPAVSELQFTRMATTVVSDYSSYFLNPANIFSHADIPLIIIGLLAILKLIKTRDIKIGLIMLLIALSYFLATSLSEFFWENLNFSKLVQFPWRFLSVAVFGGAVLSAYVLQGKRMRIISICFIFLVIVLAVKNLNVQHNFHSEAYYSTNDDTTTVRDEYMPIWVKKPPTNAPASKIEIVSGAGDVNGNEIEVTGQSVIRLNKVYYPGKAVIVNGKEVDFDYMKSGFLEISLAPGSYHVSDTFRETPSRLAADLISLVTFLGLTVLVLL